MRIQNVLLFTIVLILIGCQPGRNTEGKQSIIDKDWELIELNGKDIVRANEKEKRIFFKIDSSENRVMGYGGCNSFFGNYKQTDNNIAFSEIGSTRMICPGPDYEYEFLQMFEQVKRLEVRSETLLFLNESSEVIARFENRI